jgi:hypothetical protein
MQPHMVSIIPHQTTYGSIHRLRISLPLIPDLLDNSKYFLESDLPPPAGEELRPMSRPRITKAPRAPSLRTMVRMAVKCADAEQLGERKRRYQRQLQRRGLARPGNGRDEDELDRLLGQD